MSNAVDQGRAYPTHLYEHDMDTGAKKVKIVDETLATSAKQDAIITAIGGFQIPANDFISRGWTAGTFTEVWTFKTGGSGGTTVGTITIVYDDVNMSNIVNVTKT